MLTSEVICRMTDRDKIAYIDELQNVIHAQSRYLKDQRILIESLTDITSQLRSLVNVADRSHRTLTEMKTNADRSCH